MILCFICGFLSCRAAVEKLHCVDDAFRRQLESLQAAHQAELLRQANEKQKQIEKANQKVKYCQILTLFAEMPGFPPSCTEEQLLCAFVFIYEKQNEQKQGPHSNLIKELWQVLYKF